VAFGAHFAFNVLGRSRPGALSVAYPSLTDSRGCSGLRALAAEPEGRYGCPYAAAKVRSGRAHCKPAANYAHSGTASRAVASSPQRPCCGDPQQLRDEVARGAVRPTRIHPEGALAVSGGRLPTM
jgi:hypothetical protein